MQFSFFSKQRLLKGTLGVWGLFPTEASCGRVGWKKLPAVASGGKNAPFRPTRNEAKFRSERRGQRVTLLWRKRNLFPTEAPCGRVGRKKLPAVASGGKSSLRSRRAEKAPYGRVGRKKLPASLCAKLYASARLFGKQGRQPQPKTINPNS